MHLPIPDREVSIGFRVSCRRAYEDLRIPVLWLDRRLLGLETNRAIGRGLWSVGLLRLQRLLRRFAPRNDGAYRRHCEERSDEAIVEGARA